MEKKIGVVTVLYNSSKVLDDFFKSLNDQVYKNIILYVVDNKSPDDSLVHAKELAAKVSFDTVFIENDDNYGVAKGNNQGIIRALCDECDYILISNNDIVIPDNTISGLVDKIENTKVDIVVPKIYFYNSNGYGTLDSGHFDKERYINYAPTCFMLINSKVFYDVGLMDEQYFVYFDDTDFIWRTIKLNKKKMLYVPELSIQHKESYSTGGVRSDFTLKYYYRNKVYFQKKFIKCAEILYFINQLFFFMKKKSLGNETYKKIKASLLNGRLNNMGYLG